MNLETYFHQSELFKDFILPEVESGNVVGYAELHNVHTWLPVPHGIDHVVNDLYKAGFIICIVKVNECTYIGSSQHGRRVNNEQRNTTLNQIDRCVT